MSDSYRLGKWELGVWAPEGETRRLRYRTLVAHVPGHLGGVLYTVNGHDEGWTRAIEWDSWVRAFNAKLIEPEPHPESDPQPDYGEG